MANNRARMKVKAKQGPQYPNEILSLQDLTVRYYAKRGFFAPTPKEYRHLHELTQVGHFYPPADIELIKNVDEWVLQQVVYGNESDVLEIISSEPTLVESKKTVQDYSGRTVDNATPFQAALRAGDEVMAQKIKDIYLTSAGNDKIRQERQEKLDDQFHEVFHHGFEAHLRQQKCSADQFEQKFLIPLVDAFDSALAKSENGGSVLCQKLERFKNAFKELSLSEKIYNPNHLLKVSEVYKARYAIWDKVLNTYPWNLRTLFWCQVIGWEQRYMPANYAQAFCTGLWNMVENNKPLQRTLKLYNFVSRTPNKYIDFFPLDGETSPKLGTAFAVYSYTRVGGLHWVDDFELDLSQPVFQNLCQSKTDALRSLRGASPTPPSASPGCLMQ